MRRVILVAMAVLVGAMAVPAAAAQSRDVIDQLEVRSYYIQSGADADFEDLERVVSETTDVYYVVLASDPPEGTDLYASDALESLGVEGTVVVVSPGEVGARSTIHDDDQIDSALDALLDNLDRGYYDGFSAFASSLAPAVVATTAAGEAVVTTVATAAPSTQSGGGGGLLFLLVIVAIGAVIWWAVRRAKRNREQIVGARIDEVKAEIQAQLSEAANDVLELEDDILLSDNEQAKDLYYSGSAAYAEFQERLAAAQSFAELDELAEGADMALWQLESAEALLEGRATPNKPEPRPGYQPPATEPAAGSRRHPDLPDDLQMRRQRRDSRGSRSRRRSSGGLGGLGAAAVILKSLQQGRAPRVDSTRAATTTRSTTTRSTGVEVPKLGGSGSRSSSSTRRASTTKPKMRGRGRKRRR